MDNLLLTTEDFQEVLSSLLLAELPYNARMQFTQGASLVPDFIPSAENLPDIKNTINTIRTMFNVPMQGITAGQTLQQWATILSTEWTTTDQQITFFTSGSTGEPKPLTHDYRLHVQEVHALAKIFTDRSRVVSFVPRHHIYGFLFSILLPKALKCESVWSVPLPTPGLVDELSNGDLMVAFPLLWGKLNEMSVRFGNGVQGVTSTGPCPAETIENLCRNGLDTMYEIYGSSETGGVGYRSSPREGYSLLPHWTQENDATQLKRDHTILGSQKYTLQDELEWKTPTTFLPIRRSDNAVQVAGINVYPSRVKEILIEHPAIAECAVRLMRHDEGTRLKAIVIPQDTRCDKTDLESTIRAWAKDRLSPYELPGAWTIRNKLPLNALGKLTDW